MYVYNIEYMHVIQLTTVVNRLKNISDPKVYIGISIPVYGQFKKSCWVLQKIYITSCYKVTPSGFCCQTISMHESFLLKPCTYVLIITTDHK